MSLCPNGPVAMLVFCLLAIAQPASAEVTRIEFTSKQPYGTFRAGGYVLWQGAVHGDLSPQEAIQGIDKATRNDRGRVAYSARIILVMPEANGTGNGALLVDVPNRGLANAETLYNSPRDAPFQSGTLEQGTGFLQDHGFTIAEVYWELGHDADLPSFVDADGKKRYVEGVGFAIVRDTADFLAHAGADTAGTPNPLKGAINRTLASGRSQDGRFLKTFLLNGFNTVRDRRVFDGMHVFVSAAGLLPFCRRASARNRAVRALRRLRIRNFQVSTMGRSRSAKSSPRSRRGAKFRRRCCWSTRRQTTTRCGPRSAARAHPAYRICRSPPM